MFNNKMKGKTGEELAYYFLVQKGYKILERNYTTRLGEIDIIATDGNTLIFCEVKARQDDQCGLPSEAVTTHKTRKINQVASQYIKQRRLYNTAIRFDVVEIYLNEKRINHIENAFDSYLRY